MLENIHHVSPKPALVNDYFTDLAQNGLLLISICLNKKWCNRTIYGDLFHKPMSIKYLIIFKPMTHKQCVFTKCFISEIISYRFLYSRLFFVVLRNFSKFGAGWKPQTSHPYFKIGAINESNGSSQFKNFDNFLYSTCTALFAWPMSVNCTCGGGGGGGGEWTQITRLMGPT